MLKKALKREEFRFLAVGSLNTIWSFVSYPLYFWILSPLGVNYLVILILAYILNGIISFTSQKYLVFKTSGKHLKEIIKFLLLQISILVLNLIVLPVAVQVFHLNPVVAQTLFFGVVVVISYLFHKFVTFKHKVTNSSATSFSSTNSTNQD